MHFIPALVCFAILIPAYLSTREEKLSMLQEAYQGVLPWFLYRTAAILAQTAIYIVLILLMARRARPILREPAYDDARSTLKLLVGFICVVFVLGVLRLLTVLGVAGSMPVTQNLLIPLLASLLFGYLSFAALRRGGAAYSIAVGTKQRRAIPVPPGIAQEHRQKLVDEMERGKAYLDPELSLQRLSRSDRGAATLAFGPDQSRIRTERHGLYQFAPNRRSQSPHLR